MRMKYVGAYIVRGGEGALEALVGTLEKEKVTHRGSPDLFLRAYRKFGVEEAEELRTRARSKPVHDASRVFALFVPSITAEAQNALLKTLEEPSASALFFLIVPSPDMLLPTVRSRVQMLTIETGKDVDLLVDADDFLAATPEKRIVMLKPLYDYEDEGRDVGSIIAFLGALERRFAKGTRSSARRDGLHAIYRARTYAGDKGSLLKVLLEQVALLAPKL